MIYRMRMQSSHRRQLQELLSDHSREQACFLLCRQAIADDETLLLVVKVLALEAADLTVHRPDQLSVSPTAMLRIARLAQREDAAVCMVHTHPGSLDDVAFSRADDIGNLRTFQFFHRMVPGQHHSCLVWSGNLEHTAGRIYRSDSTWSVLGSVDIVSGENWNRYIDHAQLSAAFDTALFDRQARLLGEAGQAIISNMKIGIVGCGGIGSVAATLLVHSGIRNFTLIDFDHAEPSNLPRLLGATYDDAHHYIRKTAILQRVIKAVYPGAVVRTFNAPVEDPLMLKALVGLDGIVCGTDDTTSRAFLNQLCHQYYVPVLDLGVQFVVDPGSGKVISNVGKINFMRPGNPCLQCIGHVNPQVLAEEALDKESLEHRRNEGYLRGSDVHEPAMMTFNMQVAARGVQALLSWFSGFQPIPVEQFERYDFLGTANRGLASITRTRRSHGCPLCGPDSHLQGRGYTHPMLVAPRPAARFKRTNCNE